MIKRIVMAITLFLVCGLVFGCSANSAKDGTPVSYESDKVTMDERYEVVHNTPETVPSSTDIPDGSYLIFDNPAWNDQTTDKSPDGTVVTRMPINEDRYSVKVSKSNSTIALNDNDGVLYVEMYELINGVWTVVESEKVDVSSDAPLDFYYSESYVTPYYDLEADTLISFPVTICGETVFLETQLKKSGVRTFTYLFTGDIDSDKDVILGGYVVVSEQRHLLDEFDEVYFTDPQKLPQLDENCEIFAITIKKSK